MSRSIAPAARLAWFAAAFALGVIVFGAFVRLSNAGLSCPDWPTCYGRITWPDHHAAIAAANAAFPDRPVEVHKAWREQFHRMLASGLGTLVLALALSAVWRRPRARLAVIVAAVAAAAGVLLYVSGERVFSSLLSVVAIGLPLITAARLPRAPAWRVAVLAFAVVVFQAMLGMWTVTLLLKPAVVMGHLLGGLTLFALLSYVALKLSGVGGDDPRRIELRPWAILALVLLTAQIALGGWTSSNYAALACGADFPQCQGAWWPTMDFHQGFVLWRDIGVNYEGGVLDAAARAAIQVAHRIGALVVSLYLLWLAWRMRRDGFGGHAALLVLTLAAQVALGIGNVMLGLPLPVATAHNGVAALLLFTLVALLARTQRVATAP